MPIQHSTINNRKSTIENRQSKIVIRQFHRLPISPRNGTIDSYAKISYRNSVLISRRGHCVARLGPGANFAVFFCALGLCAVVGASREDFHGNFSGEETGRLRWPCPEYT